MTDFSYANTSFTRNSRNRKRKSRRREKASRGSCTALRTTRDTDRSRVVPFPPLTLCMCMHGEGGARRGLRTRERTTESNHTRWRKERVSYAHAESRRLLVHVQINPSREGASQKRIHTHIHTRKRDRQQIRI